FPARFEHHVDIDFVPNGKLTGAQLFHVFDTLLPKLGKIIEIVKAQTASYSFECCSPGRQVVYHAVVLCPVGFPEVYERLSCDQTRKTTPVASQTGFRRTEKQIETVLGVAYVAHIPKTAIDISNLAEDGGFAFHPCFQFRRSETRLGEILMPTTPRGALSKTPHIGESQRCASADRNWQASTRSLGRSRHLGEVPYRYLPDPGHSESASIRAPLSSSPDMGG